MKITLQKITPFLWFNNNAEEAAKFYTSVFKNSKMGAVTHYGEGAPIPAGTVMTVAFELEGISFAALNGGPDFKFNHAISFVVNCETQDEIDYYWDKLSAGGGATEQCGWLTDKFGVTWQVVPVQLSKILTSGDKEKTDRMMKKLMQMKKLIISDLENA